MKQYFKFYVEYKDSTLRIIEKETMTDIIKAHEFFKSNPNVAFVSAVISFRK